MTRCKTLILLNVEQQIYETTWQALICSSIDEEEIYKKELRNISKYRDSFCYREFSRWEMCLF